MEPIHLLNHIQTTNFDIKKDPQGVIKSKCRICGNIYMFASVMAQLQHLAYKHNGTLSDEDIQALGVKVKAGAQSAQLTPAASTSEATNSESEVEETAFERFLKTKNPQEQTDLNVAGLTEDKFSALMALNDFELFVAVIDMGIDSAKVKMVAQSIKEFREQRDSEEEESIFINFPTSVQLPKNSTIFNITNSKKFVLQDLAKNDIEHNLDDDGKSVSAVSITTLPEFVKTFHDEMHQKRYISAELLSDEVYRSMLTRIKVRLGEGYDKYFIDQPQGAADNGRVVNSQELTTYYALFEEFDEIAESIEGKSELCKCAALHSHIIDRAMRREKTNYDRDTPWTSNKGNLTLFKIPETEEYWKFDPKFDLHQYWGREFKYPALLLEEKPDPSDSGCGEDRMQLAIMSKTACSCMTLATGENAIVTAVFVCGTRYEIYYGFFGENDDMKNFYFRCVSRDLLTTGFDAFKHAFLFYNLVHRPKLSSPYDENTRANISTTLNFAAQTRKHVPTLSSFGKNKKQKIEESENKTNFETEDVETMQHHGYDVDDPVDFDAANVIIPLNWSPNVIYGTRASDKLPIVAKLATNSEIEIIKILTKSASQFIVKPLEILRRGSRKFLIMQCYKTVANITAPNSSWWWKFALALLRAVSMLHKANVTHNDIKPDHIALGNEGNADRVLHVLLLDFDVSEKHSGRDVLVQDKIGTKDWMAPEVERNQGPYNPFKADVWSVGAVLERKAKDFKSNESKIAGLIEWLKATDPEKRPTAMEAIKTVMKLEREYLVIHLEK